MEVKESTPVAMMTAGELKAFLGFTAPTVISENPGKEAAQAKRYVYGLSGIRQLFNVSHVTAQRYKDSFLSPAVIQRGRKIVVDAELAMKLFSEYSEKRK